VLATAPAKFVEPLLVRDVDERLTNTHSDLRRTESARPKRLSGARRKGAKWRKIRPYVLVKPKPRRTVRHPPLARALAVGPRRRLPADKKAPFPGPFMERMKGLEPSTFCMASCYERSPRSASFHESAL